MKNLNYLNKYRIYLSEVEIIESTLEPLLGRLGKIKEGV